MSLCPLAIGVLIVPTGFMIFSFSFAEHVNRNMGATFDMGFQFDASTEIFGKANDFNKLTFEDTGVRLFRKCEDVTGSPPNEMVRQSGRHWLDHSSVACTCPA